VGKRNIAAKVAADPTLQSLFRYLERCGVEVLE
jgi:hypothetical protein